MTNKKASSQRAGRSRRVVSEATHKKAREGLKEAHEELKEAHEHIDIVRVELKEAHEHISELEKENGQLRKEIADTTYQAAKSKADAQGKATKPKRLLGLIRDLIDYELGDKRPPLTGQPWPPTP